MSPTERTFRIFAITLVGCGLVVGVVSWLLLNRTERGPQSAGQAGASRNQPRSPEQPEGKGPKTPNVPELIEAGKRRLVAFFWTDAALASRRGDADPWLVWLKAPFAQAVLWKTVRWARQLLRVTGAG